MNSIMLSKYHCAVPVWDVRIKKSPAVNVVSTLLYKVTAVCLCVYVVGWREVTAWFRVYSTTENSYLPPGTGSVSTPLVTSRMLITSSTCLTVVTLNSLCGMSLSCWADVKLYLRSVVVLSFLRLQMHNIWAVYMYKLIQIKSRVKHVPLPFNCLRR